MSIASFPGHTPQGIVAWYPCLHMSEIIARVYGTGSVNVSVNSLSHVTGAVWRQYTNIVSSIPGFSVGNGIEVSNYQSLSSHVPSKKPSLLAIKPAVLILHFHDMKTLTDS